MATSTRCAPRSLMVSAAAATAVLKRKRLTTRKVCFKPSGSAVVPSWYWPLDALPLGILTPSARNNLRSTPELYVKFLSVLRLTVALAATNCQSCFLPAFSVSSAIIRKTLTHGSTRFCFARVFLWWLFHLATNLSASSMTTMSSPPRAARQALAVRGSSQRSLICLGVPATIMPLTAELSMSLRSMHTVWALPGPTNARASPQTCI
mmetsp:Transcript_72252/g.161707  ORF Transcript_72252/g.161707 Transcript_72252/m.161707 type:complete len:207 (-) Transcript_72252:56-676(-)